MSLNGPINDLSPSCRPPSVDQRKVLVVDDNPEVLRLMVAMVKSRGIPAMAASSRDEALLICQQEGERLAGAIVDFSLCGKGPDNLIDAMRSLAGNLKIVLTSGLPVEDCFTDADRPLINYYLPKPFRPGDLRAAAEFLMAKYHT